MTDGQDINPLRDLMPFAALIGVPRPLHMGRSLMFLETELRRDDGQLAAKVSQTQAFSYPRA